MFLFESYLYGKKAIIKVCRTRRVLLNVQSVVGEILLHVVTMLAAYSKMGNFEKFRPLPIFLAVNGVFKIKYLLIKIYFRC